MNKKLLLLLILCSFTSIIFSNSFFAEKVGEWPDELKDWKQVTLTKYSKSTYEGIDVRGRHIAEVTVSPGFKLFFYRYESPDGEIGESVRRAGSNKELLLTRVRKQSDGTTICMMPFYANFIEACVDTDQVSGPLDEMPIVHDGSLPPPDEDPFEKKLKQENPQTEKEYQKTAKEIRALGDVGIECMESMMDNEDKEIIDARDHVRSKCGSCIDVSKEPVSGGVDNLSSHSYMQECLDSLKPHAIPILGATVIISGMVCLLHYIKQGEYSLAHSGFWSSWKSEEPLDVLMGISLNSFSRALKKDIDAYYHAEEDPITCFLRDIEEEMTKIESWLLFRDKLSLIFGSYAYRFYTFADENLALLERMKRAAFVLRKKVI